MPLVWLNKRDVTSPDRDKPGKKTLQAGKHYRFPNSCVILSTHFRRNQLKKTESKCNSVFLLLKKIKIGEGTGREREHKTHTLRAIATGRGQTLLYSISYLIPGFKLQAEEQAMTNSCLHISKTVKNLPSGNETNTQLPCIDLEAAGDCDCCHWKKGDLYRKLF